MLTLCLSVSSKSATKSSSVKMSFSRLHSTVLECPFMQQLAVFVERLSRVRLDVRNPRPLLLSMRSYFNLESMKVKFLSSKTLNTGWNSSLLRECKTFSSLVCLLTGVALLLPLKSTPSMIASSVGNSTLLRRQKKLSSGSVIPSIHKSMDSHVPITIEPRVRV
jgi:hypothetical protein